MSKNTTTTTEVIPRESAGEMIQQDPAMVAEILKANLGNNRINVNTDLDRVKISPGGVTQFIEQTLDGEKVTKEITGVIVAWRDARAYWEGPYGSGGGGRPPDCSSMDAIIGVGVPGGECEKCKFAQFGSDPKGGSGQACRLTRQMLMARPGTILPQLVNITPGSYKVAKQFFMRMATYGMPVHQMAVKLTLNKAKSQGGVDYAQVVFERASYDLSDAEKNRAAALNRAIEPLIKTYTLGPKDYEAMHG